MNDFIADKFRPIIDRVSKNYDLLKSAKDDAIAKMVKSQLPGRESGPADAYRHLQWVGKVAEEYGKNAALTAGMAHEIQGGVTSPSLANYRMDTHNNALAAEIGDRVHRGEITSEQAQVRYQDAIHNGQMMDADGNLAKPDAKGAVWLPIDAWKKNPKFDNAPEVPPDLRGQEMPIGNTNWPKPDFENPGKFNPYAKEAQTTDIEPTAADTVVPTQRIEQQEPPQKPKPLTAGEELRKQYQEAVERATRPDGNTPDPNETDPVTGKKFGEMRAGEYFSALYRKRQREQANDNAINDNRTTNTGGSVSVRAHEREGGREHVQAYTRNPPRK